MPYDIAFKLPPAGYAVNSALEGETGRVQVIEFTSSEDGQHFIQRLEGFPNEILAKLNGERSISPSQVDHLLAIIQSDGSCTAYINELPIELGIRYASDVQKGQLILRDSIVDIDNLEFGVEIPPDCGFAFVFSVGWRKGYYYDFKPLSKDKQPREYDYKMVLGQAYCQVLFQERFSMSDSEWELLLAAKWFPFAMLGHTLIDKLIAHIRAGWNPDEHLLAEIDKLVRAILPNRLVSWRKSSKFHDHLSILERAVERFLANDDISATALLYPRIEGLLRTHHLAMCGPSAPASQSALRDSAVATLIDKAKCLLMPHRFATYLAKVYFASFNPSANVIDVSRHSVSHGVASPTNFNLKSSLIAFLVIDQLFYFVHDRDVSKVVQTDENN